MPLFRGIGVQVALRLLGDVEGVLVFVFGGHDVSQIAVYLLCGNLQLFGMSRFNVR